MLSTFSTAVAIAAFFLSLNPWGEVGVAEKPAGYAIVRGMDPTFPGEPAPWEGFGVGPYPSDHVVMPLVWKNNTGNTIVISNLTLVFTGVDEDGEPTGVEHRFVMVGELPNISFETLNGLSSKWPYTFTNTVLVEPHSAERSTSLFRIVKWWEAPNQCFRFIPGQTYRVDIEFQRLPAPPYGGNRRLDRY